MSSYCRPWKGPFTYEGALSHMKAKQKNRRSIYLEGGFARTVLAQHENPDEVVFTWWQMELFTYRPGGIYNLITPGRCSPGMIRRILDYTPLNEGDVKVARHQLVRQTGVSGSRVTRCRTCHGYVWQDSETEKILFSVLGGPQVLAKHQDTYWWCGERMLSKEQARHYAPCKKCGGVGRYDYGAKPIYEPILPGQPLWLDQGYSAALRAAAVGAKLASVGERG